MDFTPASARISPLDARETPVAVIIPKAVPAAGACTTISLSNDIAAVGRPFFVIVSPLLVSVLFKTIQPINLGSLPADGTTVSVNATGALTIHGVTNTVTIALQARRQGGLIAVAGSLPIVFSDYSMQKPNSFSVLSVDDHGTMELHLLFTHA